MYRRKGRNFGKGKKKEKLLSKGQTRRKKQKIQKNEIKEREGGCGRGG